MKYDSAVSLKHSLLSEGLGSHIVSASALPNAAAVTLSARAESVPKQAFALGVRGKKGDYRLAVRVQQLDAGVERAVDRVRKKAHGECDVRLVGPVVKQQTLWHRSRNRPLRIGGSVGHADITAGTLGCFVSKTSTGEEFILSNNHVLANENNAQSGDTILQHGPADGGQAPGEKIGELQRFVRLKNQHNRVDAAISSLVEGIEYYYNELTGVGVIAGIRTDPLEDGELVYKVGRTTGTTRGRVSAIELDALRVRYNMGVLAFDGQIEIEPADSEPFSLGGDRGSLIVDRNRQAVALLFAGNDVDATFANPIAEVLSSLNTALVY
jgi:hypothetical protein